MSTIINGIEYSDFNDIKKTIELTLTAEELVEIDFKVKIVGALLKAREKQGITQKDLETKTGINQSCIARIEKCRTYPQITTILKLLKPLGLTLEVVPEHKGKVKHA